MESTASASVFLADSEKAFARRRLVHAPVTVDDLPDLLGMLDLAEVEMKPRNTPPG